MLFRLIRNFRNDRRGNLAVTAGLLGVPLAIAGAMGIDSANMSRLKSGMQNAADAAVMTAALNLGRPDVGAYAGKVFDSNIAEDNYGTQSARPVYSYGGVTHDADGNPVVTVSASLAYQRRINVAPGSNTAGSRTISVSAKATLPPGDPACIFALSGTASRSINVAGSTTVDIDGCVVGSNSTADDSIYVGGAGTLDADCVVSSGGIDAGTGLTTDCSANREHYIQSPDPLATVPEPLPGVLLANPAKKDTTVAAGRYNDLDLDGTKTLAPGLYYIDGDLTVHGDITGTGVTFYLANGSVKINGAANLVITPPTTGDYAGISFFGGRTNTNSQSFTGSGTISLDGFVYFPAADVTYQGNSTSYSQCMRIVANTVTMTGNSDLSADCSAVLGGREALLAGQPYISG